MFQDIEVIDAHVHYSMQAAAGLAEFLTANGADGANLATVPHSRCITLTPGALAMKKRCEGRFYVFSALDAAAYLLHPKELGQRMVVYARLLRSAGCDGIKLLEGKPQMRRLLPIPDFDSPQWEAFWCYAEESGLPILMHLNDPESFWSADAPAFAKAQGWFYDESYVNNEAQYAQMLRVLERHPLLRICFAHFFFMSAQLPRLTEILERFPAVIVDLTPGIEMYESFSADPTAARRFFAHYGDRVVYGTDIGGRCVLSGQDKPFNLRENKRRGEIVRSFLSMDGEETIRSDGDFLIGRAPFTMRGLGLDKKALTAVLGGNFQRFAGAPAPVDGAAVLELCAKTRRSMDELSGKYPAFRPDYACVEQAEAYFSE